MSMFAAAVTLGTQHPKKRKKKTEPKFKTSKEQNSAQILPLAPKPRQSSFLQTPTDPFVKLRRDIEYKPTAREIHQRRMATDPTYRNKRVAEQRRVRGTYPNALAQLDKTVGTSWRQDPAVKRDVQRFLYARNQDQGYISSKDIASITEQIKEKKFSKARFEVMAYRNKKLSQDPGEGLFSFTTAELLDTLNTGAKVVRMRGGGVLPLSKAIQAIENKTGYTFNEYMRKLLPNFKRFERESRKRGLEEQLRRERAPKDSGWDNVLQIIGAKPHSAEDVDKSYGHMFGDTVKGLFSSPFEGVDAVADYGAKYAADLYAAKHGVKAEDILADEDMQEAIGRGKAYGKAGVAALLTGLSIANPAIGTVLTAGDYGGEALTQLGALGSGPEGKRQARESLAQYLDRYNPVGKSGGESLLALANILGAGGDTAGALKQLKHVAKLGKGLGKLDAKQVSHLLQDPAFRRMLGSQSQELLGKIKNALPPVRMDGKLAGPVIGKSKRARPESLQSRGATPRVNGDEPDLRASMDPAAPRARRDPEVEVSMGRRSGETDLDHGRRARSDLNSPSRRADPEVPRVKRTIDSAVEGLRRGGDLPGLVARRLGDALEQGVGAAPMAPVISTRRPPPSSPSPGRPSGPSERQASRRPPTESGAFTFNRPKDFDLALPVVRTGADGSKRIVIRPNLSEIGKMPILISAPNLNLLVRSSYEPVQRLKLKAAIGKVPGSKKGIVLEFRPEAVNGLLLRKGSGAVRLQKIQKNAISAVRFQSVAALKSALRNSRVAPHLDLRKATFVNGEVRVPTYKLGESMELPDGRQASSQLNAIQPGKRNPNLRSPKHITPEPIHLPKLGPGNRFIEMKDGTTSDQAIAMIRDLDVEVLVVADSNTDLVLYAAVVGERHEIDLGGYGNLLRDKKVIHNHPSGSTYSLKDLEALTEFNFAELVIAKPDGNFESIKRPKAGWPDQEKLLKRAKTEYDRLFSKADRNNWNIDKLEQTWKVALVSLLRDPQSFGNRTVSIDE